MQKFEPQKLYKIYIRSLSKTVNVRSFDVQKVDFVENTFVLRDGDILMCVDVVRPNGTKKAIASLQPWATDYVVMLCGTMCTALTGILLKQLETTCNFEIHQLDPN